MKCVSCVITSTETSAYICEYLIEYVIFGFVILFNACTIASILIWKFAVFEFSCCSLGIPICQTEFVYKVFSFLRGGFSKNARSPFEQWSKSQLSICKLLQTPKSKIGEFSVTILINELRHFEYIRFRSDKYVWSFASHIPNCSFGVDI